MSPLPIYTADDVAKAFGVSREYVQQRCREKAWPHLRVGRRYRFTEDDFGDIAKRLRVPASATSAAASWGRRGRGA